MLYNVIYLLRYKPLALLLCCYCDATADHGVRHFAENRKSTFSSDDSYATCCRIRVATPPMCMLRLASWQVGVENKSVSRVSQILKFESCDNL